MRFNDLPAASRVLGHAALLREVRRLRRAGRRIVTTNGSFDLLHVGHVRFLEQARRLGDVLIVLLNSDTSIRNLKGPTRPILPQRVRAEMMAAMRSVDYVTIFDSDNPLFLLRRIRPVVHAKGGSWKAERIAAEKQLVESWGGKLRLFPMMGHHSSTRLIHAIRAGKQVSPPVARRGPSRGGGGGR